MSARPPILALDLATRTGWAFLAGGAERPESGAIQLSPDSDPGRRIVALETWLWPRMAPLASAGVLVYESPALIPGRAAPFRVGCHLEGVVLRLARAWGVDRVLTLSPSELKLHATGHGGAGKDRVVGAMRARWALPALEDDNEADGLALLSWALAEVARGQVA